MTQAISRQGERHDAGRRASTRVRARRNLHLGPTATASQIASFNLQTALSYTLIRGELSERWGAELVSRVAEIEFNRRWIRKHCFAGSPSRVRSHENGGSTVRHGRERGRRVFRGKVNISCMRGSSLRSLVAGEASSSLLMPYRS